MGMHDLAKGFSAWSGSRDPSEIFTLLEATFNSFDKIAKQRGAYKVETVGDSYVGMYAEVVVSLGQI